MKDMGALWRAEARDPRLGFRAPVVPAAISEEKEAWKSSDAFSRGTFLKQNGI